MALPHLINWGLARNPLNWVTVFLMVLIAFIGLDVIINRNPSHSEQEV